MLVAELKPLDQSVEDVISEEFFTADQQLIGCRHFPGGKPLSELPNRVTHDATRKRVHFQIFVMSSDLRRDRRSQRIG
jgi:hypothetical protein